MSSPLDSDCQSRLLDRPIFVVGHARAGSTVLAAILAGHPDVGPKPPIAHQGGAGHLEALLRFDVHLRYASQFEQKDVWFEHCGGREVFTHMGVELVREESFASKVDVPLLTRQLTHNFVQRRFLSKAPTNTFRMRLIAKLFPGAKFVVLYRHGEEVVGSWGRRPYGFGRRVDWGEVKARRLGYRRGIEVFSRKWEETIQYAESCRDSVSMCRLTYRQLVGDPGATLARLWSFLELDPPIALPSGISTDRGGEWRRAVPLWWRPYLRARTRAGNAILDAIESETLDGVYGQHSMETV